MKQYPDGAMPDSDLPFDEIDGGGYYSSQPSSPEPEENEEPRRFEKGDRVRVNDSWEDGDEYLQKDNRVGAVIDIDSEGNCYWLHMDKPAIKEHDEGDGEGRPSDIPQGYAYFAVSSELEPIESASYFDIEAWRKNLKPGDKVRVTENLQQLEGTPEPFKARKGQVVTIKGKVECTILAPKEKSKSATYWLIEEDDGCGFWDAQWFELLDTSQPSESREIEEKKESLDPRLKTIVQTALELTQAIETTFKDSEEYPIFGMNLKEQKPVEKIRKSNLGESLLSLGVVLYHLFTGQSEHNNHSYLLDGYSKPEDMPEAFWKVINKLLKSEYRSLSEFKEDLKNFKDGG